MSSLPTTFTSYSSGPLSVYFCFPQARARLCLGLGMCERLRTQKGDALCCLELLQELPSHLTEA
eukprot:6311930-Amphidinium_carterae.1